MNFRPPLLTMFCALAITAGANAVIPEQVPDLPVLRPETPRGHIAVADIASRTPAAKSVDGDVSD